MYRGHFPPPRFFSNIQSGPFPALATNCSDLLSLSFPKPIDQKETTLRWVFQKTVKKNVHWTRKGATRHGGEWEAKLKTVKGATKSGSQKSNKSKQWSQWKHCFAENPSPILNMDKLWSLISLDIWTSLWAFYGRNICLWGGSVCLSLLYVSKSQNE